MASGSERPRRDRLPGPAGGRPRQATRQIVIAFEADGSEPGYGSWSVLATGVARHLAERDARGLTTLPPWSSEADVTVALGRGARHGGRFPVRGRRVRRSR